MLNWVGLIVNVRILSGKDEVHISQEDTIPTPYDNGRNDSNDLQNMHINFSLSIKINHPNKYQYDLYHQQAKTLIYNQLVVTNVRTILMILIRWKLQQKLNHAKS